MDLDKLIHDVVDRADPVAFDRLVAAGEAAVPALVAALTAGAGATELAAALAALRLDDPIAVLAPLADSEASSVADAATRALGASGDPRAVPILAASARRFTAVLALGDLGRPEAIPVLRDKVSRWLGDDGARRPPAEFLSSSVRRRDLGFVCDVAAALAKLGDHGLAPAVIDIAALRGANPDDGSDVRAWAARAMWCVTAPGVAQALTQLARDPDPEVAVNALLGMLYLGRVEEIESWLAMLETPDTIGATAVMCVEAVAGEHPTGEPGTPVSWRDAQAWWTRVRARFASGVCYRLGQPAHPGILLPLVAGDPSRLRTELRVRGGVWLAEGLGGFPVTAEEQARLESWWRDHAAAFPPGKLHRWGRSFAPDAVAGAVAGAVGR